ncbi:MAG: cytochrome c-type biogenesis protein CcmH [Rudaea sp.]
MRPLPIALLVVALAAGGARAVQPDEILADPALEARAREISKEVRCLVCRNESIDDSHAALARDLRLLVRERLVAGDTDAEVRDYLVVRFGEYVLLKPSFSPANALLWLLGPGAFAVGLGVVALHLRSRRRGSTPPPAPLSEAERREIDALLE